MAITREAFQVFYQELQTQNPAFDRGMYDDPEVFDLKVKPRGLPSAAVWARIEHGSIVPRVRFVVPLTNYVRTLATSGLNIDSVYASFHRFLCTLDGDEVEVDKTDSSQLKPAPDMFWDVWKDEGTASHVYTERIYPASSKAMLAKIPPNPDRTITFVDIFGGDGEFVAHLKDQLPEGYPAMFHIVDRNLPSLRKAAIRLSTPDVIVHNATDLTLKPDFLQQLNPDFVTAIGGLCRQVVTKDSAWDIARGIHRALAPGGVFLSTGLSPQLLNSNGFKAAGFDVEQMSIPENILTRQHPAQMYVLRKPVEVPAQA